jgi:hypothetical protein
MRGPVLVFVALAFCSAPQCLGQQPRPAATGQPTASKTHGGQKKGGDNSEFVCPDPLAAEACKSFTELYSAGDEGVKPLYENSVEYACFRPNTDAFFIVELTYPIFFKTHLDPSSHKMVPDDDATAYGSGRINAFSKGIQDTSILPIFYFRGKWTYPPAPIFTAVAINTLSELADTDHSGVTVESSQIAASFRYKNRTDKDIDYSLVIQRSTGRFSEAFIEQPAKSPFWEINGRCSRLSPRGPVKRNQ